MDNLHFWFLGVRIPAVLSKVNKMSDNIKITRIRTGEDLVGFLRKNYRFIRISEHNGTLTISKKGYRPYRIHPGRINNPGWKLHDCLQLLGLNHGNHNSFGGLTLFVKNYLTQRNVYDRTNAIYLGEILLAYPDYDAYSSKTMRNLRLHLEGIGICFTHENCAYLK